MNIAKELEKFLLSEIALDISPDKQSFELQEDLVALGVIDSLSILQLATFIENRFNVKITDDDIVPENFRDINGLKRMIESKQR